MKMKSYDVNSPKSKQIQRNWPQIYSILTVTLNAIATGQLLAWPSPSIPQLTSEEHPDRMSMANASYLTIIPAIAMLFASPFVGKLIDIMGRKYAILSVTFSYIISWILTAIGGSLWVYYLARIFDGIGDACFFTTIPCYISEVATPQVRGTWGNCMSLSMFFGQFLMNIIGAYCDIPYAAYLSLMVPFMFLLNFPFLPESPYYQIMKGRHEDAAKSLRWLRGVEDVDDELAQLTLDVQRQLSETGRFVDLFLIKSNRRACLIGILIRATQQFSGITAFIVYAQTVFIESGSDLSASMSAIVFSGILFVCTCVGSLFLDRLGRRPAMLASATGSFLVLAVQTALFYMHSEMNWTFDGFEIFPLISMVAFVLVYSFGLGLVPTLMLGELFSSSIKGKAFILMNIFFGISIASSAKIFAVFLEYIGLYAAFLFLTVTSFIGIGVSYFFVPETKGKSLEEIQQALKD